MTSQEVEKTEILKPLSLHLTPNSTPLQSSNFSQVELELELELELDKEFEIQKEKSKTRFQNERNVQVYIRFRPVNVDDLENYGDRNEKVKNHKMNSTFSWKIDPEEKQLFYKDLDKGYSFDHIFTQTTATSKIYESVVQNLIFKFLKGFNGTIFAYGQTNSGKTHTMFGTPEDRGLVFLSISDIFKYFHQAADKIGNTLNQELKMAFVEIYNEEIIDLLEGESDIDDFERPKTPLSLSLRPSSRSQSSDEKNNVFASASNLITRPQSRSMTEISTNPTVFSSKGHPLVKSQSYIQEGEKTKIKRSKSALGERRRPSIFKTDNHIREEMEEEVEKEMEGESNSEPLVSMNIKNRDSISREFDELYLEDTDHDHYLLPSPGSFDSPSSAKSHQSVSPLFYLASPSSAPPVSTVRSSLSKTPKTNNHFSFQQITPSSSLSSSSSSSSLSLSSSSSSSSSSLSTLTRTTTATIPVNSKSAVSQKRNLPKSKSFHDLRSYSSISTKKPTTTTNKTNVNSKAKSKLRLVPDSKNKKGGKGFVVQGLTWKTVSNESMVEKLIQLGTERRTFGVSKLNDHSSRSHTIVRFVYDVEKHIFQSGSEATEKTRTISELNLVDLAGSEGYMDKADTKTKSETKNINVSLTHLRSVIKALSKENFTEYIPYRNSVLTQLLANSLGGNSKTILLATASLLPSQDAITKSTLEFAHLAKSMKNTAVIGVTRTAGSLKREESLRAMKIAQQSAVEHAQKMTEELTLQLKITESKLAFLQHEKDQFIKEQQAMNSEIKQLIVKNDKLTQELKTTTEQFHFLQSEHENVLKENKKLKIRIAELEKEIQNLKLLLEEQIQIRESTTKAIQKILLEKKEQEIQHLKQIKQNQLLQDRKHKTEMTKLHALHQKTINDFKLTQTMVEKKHFLEIQQTKKCLENLETEQKKFQHQSQKREEELINQFEKQKQEQKIIQDLFHKKEKELEMQLHLAQVHLQHAEKEHEQFQTTYLSNAKTEKDLIQKKLQKDFKIIKQKLENKIESLEQDLLFAKQEVQKIQKIYEKERDIKIDGENKFFFAIQESQEKQKIRETINEKEKQILENELLLAKQRIEEVQQVQETKHKEIQNLNNELLLTQQKLQNIQESHKNLQSDHHQIQQEIQNVREIHQKYILEQNFTTNQLQQTSEIQKQKNQENETNAKREFKDEIQKLQNLHAEEKVKLQTEIHTLHTKIHEQQSNQLHTLQKEETKLQEQKEIIEKLLNEKKQKEMDFIQAQQNFDHVTQEFRNTFQQEKEQVFLEMEMKTQHYQIQIEKLEEKCTNWQIAFEREKRAATIFDKEQAQLHDSLTSHYALEIKQLTENHQKLHCDFQSKISTLELELTFEKQLFQKHEIQNFKIIQNLEQKLQEMSKKIAERSAIQESFPLSSTSSPLEIMHIPQQSEFNSSSAITIANASHTTPKTGFFHQPRKEIKHASTPKQSHSLTEYLKQIQILKQETTSKDAIILKQNLIINRLKQCGKKKR